MKSYIDSIGGTGLICMFDDNSADTSGNGHGNGRVNDVNSMISEWGRIQAVFGSYRRIYYEIFNEPFGYSDAAEYLSVMRSIYVGAGLPSGRVVLDCLSYAHKCRSLVAAGWTG